MKTHRRGFARLLPTFTLAITAAVWLAAPRAALAQEDKCPKAAAKTSEENFAKADAKYSLQKFDEAIKYFEAAFEACPSQWYLYGIAQSYRKLDDCKNAIFFYKRYLAFAENEPKDRHPEVEEKVTSVFLPELEEKCKNDERIRNTPPDDARPGGGKPDGGKPDGGTTGGGKPDGGKPAGGTTGGAKPDGGKPAGGTTGGAKPDGGKPNGGTQVATNDDDDDDDDDDDVGGITMGPPKATKLSSDIELGAAILTGLGDMVNVPAQFSLRIGGGYPLNFGKIELVAGGVFTYTPVPWDTGGASGTASLISLLANASVGYPVIPKLNIRGEVGLGAQFFGGLAAGNPFTLNGLEANGALGMFNLRFALGAEYSVTNNIILTATVPAISYSPAPANMRMDLSSVTRIEFMVGAGYKM